MSGNTIGQKVTAALNTNKKPSDDSLLHKLEDDNVAASFDSMEGVGTKSAPSFIRDTLPAAAYIAASVSHLTAGAGALTDIIPNPLTEFFDNYALKFSKLVNVANYTYKGIEAMTGKPVKKGDKTLWEGGNRAWEGLSRLAYSAIIPWVPLESVFTYSGISSGTTMIEQAQRSKIKYKNATKKSPEGSPQSLREDLEENSKAFKTMFRETFQNLWGKDRKIFLPLKKETGGHTMFFSAWGNIIGAITGIMAGSNHSSLLGKFAAIVRNAGGIGCDWAKLIHPDINNKLSAIFYGMVSIFDVTKSFTSPETSHTLSHFSMAMNNFANYYYVNTTKTTTDKTFKNYDVSHAH